MIQDNVMWLGYNNGETKWFQVPPDYDILTNSRVKVVDGVKYFSFGSILWYTNLDTTKRHENITLFKHYSPDEFPHYDNYDAIDVSMISNIPHDYNGAMGVPITFIDKYNPNQFIILGNLDSYAPDGYSLSGAIYIGGKKIFKRIVIKHNYGQE